MKIKTANLIGPALDWAVAMCKGKQLDLDDPRDPWLVVDGIADQPLHSYTPSTDWAQGGPLIEYYWVELQNGSNLHPDLWGACMWSDTDAGVPLWEGKGTTPLIAAMRCFVASRLGDEVDIPEELL